MVRISLVDEWNMNVSSHFGFSVFSIVLVLFFFEDSLSVWLFDVTISQYGLQDPVGTTPKFRSERELDFERRRTKDQQTSNVQCPESPSCNDLDTQQVDALSLGRN
jgi:hypothetical protein